MVVVMKIMVTSFKRSHTCPATLSAPTPAAGHHRPMPLLETPGHSQTSLDQSLMGSLLLSPGFWCTRFCLCPPRVNFPVPCMFWELYGGVNGNLLQEGLCHTQVCCTQSSCPCGSPLLIHSSTGNRLSSASGSVGFLGPGVHKPSEHLWPEWGLILNMNLPLLPSCWASALPLDMGYVLMVSPVKRSHYTWPWMWGISSGLLQQSTTTASDLGRVVCPLNLSPLQCQAVYSQHGPKFHVAGHRGSSLAVFSQIFVILPYTFLD